MVGAITIKMKYPNDVRIIDGEWRKRCGICGKYFAFKSFLPIEKIRGRYSPYCKDCQKFRKVYIIEKGVKKPDEI